MKLRAVTLAALALAAASAGATVRGSLADARVALRVGGWSLSQPALVLLERVARVRRPDASAAAVAAAALEDHVLGVHARASVDDAALFGDQAVALTPEAAAEASLDASLHAAWREPMDAALGADGGTRFVVRRHPLARERLRELLGAGTTPRLDDRLDATREAALRELVLVDWRIDDADAGHVTLHEVWTRLTLQERNALYGGDADYAMHRAEELVRRAAIRHWVRANTGLDAADLAGLQALLADHARRIALARREGAIDGDHYHSVELERLRAQVSDADIRRWYDAHPDEFRRTERVRARHVHCADEARCEAASAALKRGLPFAEVARRWSDAPDAARGGELGWTDAERARGDWLAQLAFPQPPGPPTGALREPAGAAGEGGWQIVEVLERVQGRHPADSEAVRFGAGRAIARERAVARFGELRARLLAASEIELNPALLGFDASALAAEGVR